MRKLVVAASAAVFLAAGLLGLNATQATGSNDTVNACISSSHTLTHVHLDSPLACPSQQPVSWPVAVGTPPPSPSPSPTATPTATATPTPSPTGSSGSCTVPLGGGCRYQWAGWQGSNGYNTYVTDQGVDPSAGDTGSITATSPSSWTATANYNSCGGCVQTYTAVDQLTNNWGTAGWNGSSDTPLSALSSLSITYNESSPSSSGDQYEFSPDIWTNYAGQLCGGCGDVMMWVDTSAQRCNAVSGWPILGNPVIDGQNWTAYVGPSVKGDEIILILDGPAGSGTCAQQSSGTIDVYAALQWLSANPGQTGFPAFSNLTMSQLNTGWEITDGDGAPFTVNSLAYNATVN